MTIKSVEVADYTGPYPWEKTGRRVIVQEFANKMQLTILDDLEPSDSGVTVQVYFEDLRRAWEAVRR